MIPKPEKSETCIEVGCDRPRYRRQRRCSTCIGRRQRARRKAGLAPRVKKYPEVAKCATCGGEYVRSRKPSAKRPRPATYCSKACAAKGDGFKRGTKKRRKTNTLALDRLAGALCRAEGMCAAIGYVPPPDPDPEAEAPVEVKCAGALSWAHIVSRSYRRIRYWRSNCMPLCMGHHVYFTHRPLHWEMFVEEQIGPDAYVRLRRAAFFSPKLDKAEVFEALVEGRWPEEHEPEVIE